MRRVLYLHRAFRAPRVPQRIAKRCISDYLKNVQEAETVQDFRGLIKEMHRKNYNIRRIQYGLVGFGCLFAYLFYEKIVDWLSDQTTTVTTKSMDDPEFLEKVVKVGTEAGKQIVYNLSQDEETVQTFKQFFSYLFTTEPIVGAASQLSDETVRTLLFDEQHSELREYIALFANQITHDIAKDILNNQQLQHHTGNFLWSSVNSAFNPMYSSGGKQETSPDLVQEKQ